MRTKRFAYSNSEYTAEKRRSSAVFRKMSTTYRTLSCCTDFRNASLLPCCPSLQTQYKTRRRRNARFSPHRIARPQYHPRRVAPQYWDRGPWWSRLNSPKWRRGLRTKFPDCIKSAMKCSLCAGGVNFFCDHIIFHSIAIYTDNKVHLTASRSCIANYGWIKI